MSGIFGVVSQSNCMDDLFYGTDYHTWARSSAGWPYRMARYTARFTA